ncbi:hypothetical protein IH979_01010, partial [Patescibacteria group bacterium]|nr:hypothetical protein [Patescibacteria group bacterium]
SEEQFSISLEVDEQLVSGAEATVKIHYSNPTAVPIASLSIDARIPVTFKIFSMTPLPANTEDLIWEIGTLNPGSDGTIVLEGVWIAEVPSSTPIQVFANFRPANFNADFQDIETVHVTTLDSTLVPTFEGPEEAQSGETLTYLVKIENQGERAFENVEFALTIPDGFFLDSSYPEIPAGLSPTWTLETIESGEIVEISFEGSFAADTEGFQYFDVATGIRDDERFLTQATTQGFTDVIGTNFELQLVANGSIEDIAVALNDQLRMTIAYENTGEADLEDVSLLLDFQSELPMPILWNEAELDGGTLTQEGVRWTIDNLPPNDKQILNLVLPIDSAVGTGQTDTFSAVASATVGEMVIRSSPIQIFINTEAKFSAEIRYFTQEGAPLGNGPLPPKVEEKTTYRAIWKIENTLHDLEDVRVSAVLPPHVSWEDRVQTDLGTVRYDESSRTITWEITTLPTTITSIDANFAISITPDSGDVGTFVKLISGSTFSAKDSKTEVSIQRTTDSLTADLQNDEFAAGKGTVVE